MKVFIFLMVILAAFTPGKAQFYNLVSDDDYATVVLKNDSLLKIDSTDCFARDSRANALFYLSRYGEAIDDINLTIKNCKQPDIETYIFRARCYQKMKDYQAAIIDFTKAVSLAALDYNTGNICFQIGFCYAELGEYEKAVDWYTNAIAREPAEGINYYNRGLIYQNVKNNKAACDDFRQAVLLGLQSAQFTLDQFCK